MELKDIIFSSLNCLREGVVITDAVLDEPGPKIVFANKTMEDITGYKPEEMLGQTPRVLQGDKTDKEQRKWMKAELAAGRSVRVEIENYRKDKTTYWVDLSIDPVFDEQGQIVNFIAIQNDISKQKELEQELASYVNRLLEIKANLAKIMI